MNLTVIRNCPLPRKRFKDRIQILKGEASYTGLEDECVDLVVSNGVFHELSSPEVVLREIVRVLKPNGWVVITDFRKGN
jgi:ubiquinone/menaquinone biosynthesis C-methylase UbiE